MANAVGPANDTALRWSTAKLGEVCHINPPKPKRGTVQPSLPVSFVPMPAVDAQSGTIASPTVRPYAEVAKGFTAFRDGDVIMAKITPCMENGKAAIVHGLTNGLGFGSTEFHVLRPTERVLAAYVYYFIRQGSFRQAAEMEMTGSVGQKRVPADFIESAEIPLPPLAEQKRIVEAIERLTARVDAARARLAVVPAILKRFRQAVLAAACSGRLTEDWREANPESESTQSLVVTMRARKTKPPRDLEHVPDSPAPPSWSWTSLETLCSAIVDCPHSTPKWTTAGRLCARTSNFRPGVLDLAEKSFVSDATYRERVARLVPEPGDVLYSREGGILGIACMIPPATHLCLGQRMMLMRPWPEVSAVFFMHCLNSRPITDRVRELTGGTASPHLNVGDIKMFPMPVPPSAEQNEVVRRVESLMKLADAIERRVATAQSRADTLTQSILARAFRGELANNAFDLSQLNITVPRAAEATSPTFSSTAIQPTPSGSPNRSRGRTGR